MRTVQQSQPPHEQERQCGDHSRAHQDEKDVCVLDLKGNHHASHQGTDYRAATANGRGPANTRGAAARGIESCG